MGLAVWAHATFGGETSVEELRFSILIIGIWIETIVLRVKMQNSCFIDFQPFSLFSPLSCSGVLGLPGYL